MVFRSLEIFSGVFRCFFLPQTNFYRMDDRYDSALLGILQHEGKIEKFLNVVLGFLYRRTDFYRIMKGKDDKLGFPPGVSLKMLTTIFQQYDAMTRRDDEIRDARTEAKKQPEKKKETTANTCAKADSAGKGDTQLPAVGTQQNSGQDCVVASEGDKIQSMEVNNDNSRSNAVVASEKSQGNSNSVQSEAKTKTDEDDEDPELTKQQQAFQSNSESYNGAIRDNYSWSQSITDVDVRVKVPSYIRKGRDVKVDVAKKHIKVSHKDDKGQWNVVVDGDLTWEVNKEDSMWTLNPGEKIHINFEKKEERWWDALLSDEPKINVRKIDASRPMTDLDEEAQAKIEEMMYNDRRKKMGLPTAQEQKMQDMLKNAWDAEGSPFKGQPFDPSKFSMDQSGVINMKNT